MSLASCKVILGKKSWEVLKGLLEFLLTVTTRQTVLIFTEIPIVHFWKRDSKVIFFFFFYWTSAQWWTFMAHNQINLCRVFFIFKLKKLNTHTKKKRTSQLNSILLEAHKWPIWNFTLGRLYFPTIDRIFWLSVFSLLYGRGRYYTSYERVQNLQLRTRAKKKQKQVIV